MAVNMANVSAKQITERRAAAVGTLLMGRRAFGLLKSGRLPKGDAISLAQAAGVMAAKRTPDLLPLCHPISLDSVDVEISLDASLPGAHVRCTAAVAAKTGVEMEALTGATAALLCLYDLLKPVDPVLEIVAVRLEYKSGGKKGYWTHPKTQTPPKAATKRPRIGTAAVITVSDRAFKKIYRDTSGPALAAGLKRIGFSIKKRIISPDDRTVLEAHIRRAARGVDVVILTGGTGLSSRDVTPESVMAVCDRLIPGIGESLRASGGPATAALSRSVAGQLGKCVIVALPGSGGGVRDGLYVLENLLPHAIHISHDGKH
ncbi:MAG: bifunctional molybdenum cofactor biosynthesis protein MoaC/MoaB [Elusimicrobiota bacterium]|nr:bifunctional molybdenum cofactor biosynthesis protein MoaC/MoaB [Elusimicrobiota bacterium]